MAYITVSNVDTNSCDVSCGGLDTSWGGGTRYFYYYARRNVEPNESYYDVSAETSIGGSPSAGASCSINGLAAGCKYYVKCYVYYNRRVETSLGEAGTLVSYEWTHLATISSVNFYTRPNDWAWDTDIRDTVDVPFSNSALHPVTAIEWNNFLNRINQFRLYAGVSSYNFNPSMVYSGDDFTPAIYNDAVRAIKGVSGYGSWLNYINDDTQLSAALFTLLRDELNQVGG